MLLKAFFVFIVINIMFPYMAEFMCSEIYRGTLESFIFSKRGMINIPPMCFQRIYISCQSLSKVKATGMLLHLDSQLGEIAMLYQFNEKKYSGSSNSKLTLYPSETVKKLNFKIEL